ncbi:hypothetical protein [Paraburkholderia aromaticivorans]|uniref:Uncharacterized protein n=1 Tax=Paraburkholderia aromaticivorans TaxID=2026199 RepID=A0A248VF53_9BURK|nr:hypothetical protein [Paraburkholderia aromaticivorans]ASV97598.1 hypothetical protein CJU94_05120 [Paraburkholderia aromaticivorans]
MSVRENAKLCAARGVARAADMVSEGERAWFSTLAARAIGQPEALKPISECVHTVSWFTERDRGIQCRKNGKTKFREKCLGETSWLFTCARCIDEC